MCPSSPACTTVIITQSTLRTLYGLRYVHFTELNSLQCRLSSHHPSKPYPSRAGGRISITTELCFVRIPRNSALFNFLLEELYANSYVGNFLEELYAHLVAYTRMCFERYIDYMR